jgi:ribosomal protein S27E
LADEERPVPAPRLPRGAKDLPICSECCIEVGFLCCPVHGIRDLPAWLVQWLRDLQNPQAQQTAAIGYWSQSMETIISCPECERKLVAPSERTETVRCPKCLATWKLTAGEAAEPLREKDTLADRFERSGLLYPDVDFVPSPFIGCPDCELEPDLAIGFPDKEDWTERRLRVMRCRIHGTRWVDYVHWAGEKGVLWSELRTSDTLADRRLKEVMRP